jgi:hypothetical protein
MSPTHALWSRPPAVPRLPRETFLRGRFARCGNDNALAKLLGLTIAGAFVTQIFFMAKSRTRVHW